LACTVIEYVPAGVDGSVESVIELVHVGRHCDGANAAVAPDGRPDALNVTAVDDPDRRVAVTVDVTEPPAVTVPDVGFTAMLKLNGAWTVKEYVVVRVTPPPVALTVIEYVPLGVEVVVDIVIVLVHVGTHWVGANDALAPDGRPDVLNVTAVDVPDTRVAVTDAVTEPPAVTVPDVGLTARLKLNGAWTVKEYVVVRVRPPPTAFTVMG
jgi:hypothetical protein